MEVGRLSLRIDVRESPWSAAQSIVDSLVRAGYVGVFVGGCIRDHLLGRAITDVDVATDATPDQVMELFPRAIGVGAQFGVVVVPEAGHNVEVASFRSDAAYIDGRRPSGIIFADEETDTARRDFTINALVYDPIRQEIRDHVGGLADLNAQILRVVGDPEARLREDRLRVLRALRFAAHCQFTIEPASAAALERVKPTGLSRERIWDEWDKALRGSHRSAWWNLVQTYELAPVFYPLIQSTDAEVDGIILDALPSQAYPVYLGQAVLLRSCSVMEVERWLKNEPISRERRQIINYLVQWHDPNHVIELPDTERRRVLTSVYSDDCQVLWSAIAPGQPTEDLIREAAQLAKRPTIALLKGADLVELGLPPGPRMGELLCNLVDAQLAGNVTTESEAKEWVRQQINQE